MDKTLLSGISAQQIQRRLDRILPEVQKPGRYVGGEFNQIVHDWDSCNVRTALLFPDIYDLGMPNLGMSILYDEINHHPGALAERVFLPWTDMEEKMRAAQIPLYTLESFHPVAQFDLLCITLPYETLYTNVLAALELSGIPLRSKDRDASYPLVVAGGHSAFDPEPMADFIDVFAIGEGEEIIHDILDAYSGWKQTGQSKETLLTQLAKIPGIYIPSLYTVDYQPDGTIQAVQAIHDAPPVIKKRILRRLPPPVTRFLVPNIDIVQNRVAIEIMRGCARGCRFCHAGFINRPVRERPVEEIINAIAESLAATGHEEVALLSLSSSDYSHINQLVQAIRERFGESNVSVALPSLRIESFSDELIANLKALKASGGFTIAPEAGTTRMREIINKPIPHEQVMETARAVFRHGWNNIKLYFMIGHPQETEDDVLAIADLILAIAKEGRRIAGGRTKIHAGISTFVPKPHTPFQWTTCLPENEISAKLQMLKNEIRHPSIRLSWTDARLTQLESWLARGDRRLGAVIQRAFELGCRFDAWQDQFRYDHWLQAFSDCGLDPSFYAQRPRSLEEILPWQHIHTGVKLEYLQKEYRRSQKEEPSGDCRDRCLACGILQAFPISSPAEDAQYCAFPV